MSASACAVQISRLAIKYRYLTRTLQDTEERIGQIRAAALTRPLVPTEWNDLMRLIVAGDTLARAAGAIVVAAREIRGASS